MTKSIRGVLIAGVMAVGLLPAFDLSAQSLSWAFSGEAAGDKTYVLFGQPTLVFGPKVGWRPLLELGGHVVWSDDGLGNKQSAWGITPEAGLRWQDTGGFIEGDAGYDFSGKDDHFAPFGGGKSGVVTGLHVEYYGTGAWAAQGIANYNWGAKFLWTRAQLLREIAKMADGSDVKLGARLTWDAQTDSGIPSGSRYQGTYLGPAVMFTTPKGIGLQASAGWKHNHPVGIKQNTWYAQVDLYFP